MSLKTSTTTIVLHTHAHTHTKKSDFLSFRMLKWRGKDYMIELREGKNKKNTDETLMIDVT